MRVLGLIGLLLALLSVAWLAREQLGVSRSVDRSAPEATRNATPARHVQQFGQQLEQLMQAPRELPEDAR